MENNIVFPPASVILKQPLKTIATGLFILSSLCCLDFVKPASLLLFATPLLSAVLLFFKRYRAAYLFLLVTTMALYCFLYSHAVIKAGKTEAVGQDEYTIRITSVAQKLDGSRKIYAKTEGGALIYVYAEERAFSTGDTVVVKGEMEEPEGPTNPGQFDFKNYLKKKGIYRVLYCDEAVRLTPAGGIYILSNRIGVFFCNIRTDLFELITTGASDLTRGLIAAIIFGDTSLADDDVNRIFTLAGCVHLLAVSGTHFAGFLMILPIVFENMRLSRKKSIIFYTCFCVLTGFLTMWTESVTRAAIMSASRYAGRDSISAMSLSCVIMILANPFSSLSLGFQMSFATCVAIKLFAGNINDRLMKLPLMNQSFSSNISVILAAFLGTVPFASSVCLRISAVTIACQFLASFFASAACAAFVPCVLLCLLFPGAAEYLAAPVKLAVNLTYKTAEICSKVALNTTDLSRLPRYLTLSVFFLLALILLPRCFLKKYFKKPAMLGVAVCSAFFVFDYINAPLATVVFADVGQGDCALVITDGYTALIDSGVYEEGETVGDILDYYGIASVDYGILSHWDSDHAAGLAYLDAEGRIGTLCTGYTEADEQIRDFLSEYMGVESGFESYVSETFVKTRAGDVFELSDACELRVISPEKASDGGNESSLVMVLECGDTSVLFTGDIGQETEERLVSSGILSDCDILKVAHHGSKYSSSAEFLDAVCPAYSVISVGKYNNYGHPAPETLGRLEACCTEVLKTSESGAVTVKIYEGYYTVEDFCA